MVAVLKRKEAKRLSNDEVTELMMDYRAQWLTVTDCVNIIVNCGTIEDIHGVGVVPLVESTKVEAGIRGRLLMLRSGNKTRST